MRTFCYACYSVRKRQDMDRAREIETYFEIKMNKCKNLFSLFSFAACRQQCTQRNCVRTDNEIEDMLLWWLFVYYIIQRDIYFHLCALQEFQCSKASWILYDIIIIWMGKEICIEISSNIYSSISLHLTHWLKTVRMAMANNNHKNNKRWTE